MEYLFIGIILIVSFSIYFLYYIYNRRKWKGIEQLNLGWAIKKKTCYIDKRGYLRWKENDKLCHRDIAYNYIYKVLYREGILTKKFSEYDVHHKDENKLNNNPENLEILTREEHQNFHQNLLVRKGKKYIKFAKTNKIYCDTPDAYLIADIWLPKSQIIIEYGWVYVSEYIYYRRFFKPNFRT